MANIVISFQSPLVFNRQHVVPPFYEGLGSAFTEQGHNVFFVVTSDFLSRPFNGNNVPILKCLKYEVLEKIKAPAHISSQSHSRRHH